MGCVQAKSSTYSPPPALEKLKLESGYVKGVGGGRVIVVKNGGASGDKRVSGEGAGGGGGSRKSVRKKIGDDELVDGWPKWLVDNIPREVLAGLVPKSADSYDKLAKVEQLHRIFKLCGSPSEDYWKKLKSSTTFRPAQHYKPSFQEAFGDFPSSSFGILTTLLALDPAYRGTATSALQNQFFSSSPLACDLSGLPVMNKEEDEPSQNIKPKRRRSSKAKKRSHKNQEDHGTKDPTTEQARGDGESSKEMEKNADLNSASSSTFSTWKPIRRHEESLHNTSLSPILCSNLKRSPRTEGHPNALRNIQNFTLLQASITDIINHRQGNEFAPFSRTLSTLDFRTLDPEKISKLFGLDKD
ncbi:hypothetical protein Q3G72_013255 [Acer saccharum]|nr:hypothetical protein Q3G72_013255 [Acer saccharum]